MFFWPELGYPIVIATIKISILISYMRIFGRLEWFRRVVFAIGTLTIIWFLGHFFSVIFQCTPVDKVWYPSKPGTCIDLVAFLWGNSISNTILEYIILLLPVVPVWKLQMAPVQKMLVLSSFALGSVYVFRSRSRISGLTISSACAASTIRAVTTGTVDFSDLSRSLPRPDSSILGGRTASANYEARVRFRGRDLDLH